jgi:hypothetical protein
MKNFLILLWNLILFGLALVGVVYFGQNPLCNIYRSVCSYDISDAGQGADPMDDMRSNAVDQEVV